MFAEPGRLTAESRLSLLDKAPKGDVAVIDVRPEAGRKPAF